MEFEIGSATLNPRLGNRRAGAVVLVQDTGSGQVNFVDTLVVDERRWGFKVGSLHHAMHHIQSKAVDAADQPESQYGFHFMVDLRLHALPLRKM
ncbi:hypothetical protein [Arthrobacter sp. LAPM80]|uniref:hypothetical protein n=1 Tax=Arthrobacter sp. LAPM80 TaxID=3141788 RepID=UPI00398B25CB